MYMLMTCIQKKAPVREEVWGSPGPVENRLAGEQGDSWGGITSYNLLDLQPNTQHGHVSRPRHSACPI